MAGHGGSGTTYRGYTIPHNKRWHTVAGKGLCAVMWFWVFYRAKQDGAVLLGLRHPWDGHDDHSHGHGPEHEGLVGLATHDTSPLLETQLVFELLSHRRRRCPAGTWRSVGTPFWSEVETMRRRCRRWWRPRRSMALLHAAKQQPT
ncbi:hypothetical protein GUJ93_ZPchr0006g43379 [Zizania palustris]|uniref:NADH dehydrogenase [ubiquinone] 1 beta subcomplex subunit 2 n=1 Tax=Zizania palustris TaxID=103762 RepID=A0A8J5VKB0_ZIZPA|nr:hypothetical protein GUJ93_ZPchr0006g43379 [Zizania palustris]